MARVNTLCHIDDIPELGSKGFKPGEAQVFAVKKNGRIYVYRNYCPHLGIPLEWVEDQFLDSSKSMIQCANHGALFLMNTGKCVSGPCSGQSLTKVPFEIIDGYIVANL